MHFGCPATGRPFDPGGDGSPSADRHSTRKPANVSTIHDPEHRAQSGGPRPAESSGGRRAGVRSAVGYRLSQFTVHSSQFTVHGSRFTVQMTDGFSVERSETPGSQQLPIERSETPKGQPTSEERMDTSDRSSSTGPASLLNLIMATSTRAASTKATIRGRSATNDVT